MASLEKWWDRLAEEDCFVPEWAFTRAEEGVVDLTANLHQPRPQADGTSSRRPSPFDRGQHKPRLPMSPGARARGLVGRVARDAAAKSERLVHLRSGAD
jgi:hypothetical protein